MRISPELRKRTKAYASGIVRLFRELPARDKAVQTLGLQLLRSGTSVAAHTREASRARSDAEFCSKLDGLLQEADESFVMSAFPQASRLPHPVRITEQVWPEGTVPVVTIRCITYNHAKFIRDAIEGFLMQETTFPVEILIHDDASTDGTADIIREYAAKYPQLLQAVLQKENQYSKGGEAWARVREHLHALIRGEFIALCEGDDYWTSPAKLEQQYGVLLRNPDVSMCFHNALEEVTTTGESRIFNKEFSGERFYLEHMFKHAFVIPTASMLYRKNWLADPGWLQFCLCGDRAIQLLLADRGPFAFIDKPWSVYRTHPGGMTRSVTKNYAKTVIPNWIAMYYGFDETTQHRHRALLRKEIRRLVRERSRFQIYALRDEQTSFLGEMAPPDQMQSPDQCRNVINSLLYDTASCLQEPDKGWFLESEICKATRAEALLSAGNAWYVRKNYGKAEKFYRAASLEGQLRARFYCALLRLGLAGRVLRSIIHRTSLAWQRVSG